LPYDEACRIPFIVRGPGVDRGYLSNALVHDQATSCGTVRCS
jgi:hypothetical protein